MVQGLIFFIASLLVFIIFTETVTIKVLFDKKTVIQIHFTVFALYLEESDASSSKTGKERKGRKRRRRDTATLFSYLKKLIPYSHISVTDLTLYLPQNDPAKYVLIRTGAISFISAVMTYARSKADFFQYRDITVKASDNNNLAATLNMSITVSLLRILTASAVLIKKHGD